MPRSLQDRPIIYTDDGGYMSENPPLTPEILYEKMVKVFGGTQTALWWSIGDHEVYHYETQVGEIMGNGYDLSDLSDGLRRIAENTRHLMQTAGGPLTVLIDLCRGAGLEFFPRVRMNSHYLYNAPGSPDYGKFRVEHPELLIGRPGEDIPDGTIDWDIRTGKDFAYAPVRDYMYSIITELFERFDIDGLEMDFNRHPAFFRREEAYQCRYLMTGLVRRVRDRMREVSASRGREMELAVRVPPTVADSTRIGLDVVEWMNEGLVDVVVVGKGSIPFEMPLREFVEAAEGTGIPVYGCIEALKPASDDDAVRALAARFWRAGAGVYLYNFHYLADKWKRRMLNQIDDPSTLARLDKRYELDHTDRIAYGGHGGAFRNAVPAAQLPVALHETLTGHGPILRIDIADDLEAAVADGSLGRCDLALFLDKWDNNDELEIRINGEILPWSSSRKAPSQASLRGIRGIQYEVGSPPLRQGNNELEVCLSPYSHRDQDPAVLIGVEVTITYRND